MKASTQKNSETYLVQGLAFTNTREGRPPGAQLITDPPPTSLQYFVFTFDTRHDSNDMQQVTCDT